MNFVKQLVPIKHGARAGASFCISRSIHESTVEVNSKEEEVVIALGSNTEPAYVIDQPLFLNSAIRANTKLNPQKLLETVKEIERDMGRTADIRIPHKRMWERPFVLGPLTDVLGHDMENDVIGFWNDTSGFLGGVFDAWEKSGGESNVGPGGMRRVLPVSGGL
ncbi:Folate synthesis bifunctional protein-mitochondrial [Striga hermonthica]|uniref:2-amino-4-hydroxy-6-hydroxymethyldihydropteridine diphosphokinase n=1 Tax=Striga hermonthica TaxID=68872 RepID=A0A9N7RFV8_STRHE|nr:Folate synthesis bifunctional protein-mitochondrial [Striga hermonthica]